VSGLGQAMMTSPVMCYYWLKVCDWLWPSK